MTWVASSLIYQSYCAIGSDNVVAYFVLMFFAMLSYPIGNHCYKTNSWVGIIWHLFIHVLGNVANCVLYSGYITPLKDLKWHVFNLQRSGIGNDLKQSTPQGCGFKSSPV
jgi:hypothetical protein